MVVKTSIALLLGFAGVNVQGEPSLLIRQVQRVKNITYNEFKNKFSRSDLAVPLIIENSMDEIFDINDWTRENINAVCGDRSIMRKRRCEDNQAREEAKIDVYDCHCVREFNASLIGKSWAGLQPSDTYSLGIRTLSDFLRVQDTPQGAHLYLHDAPLLHYCPPMMERLRLPRYFPHDLRLFNSDPERIGKGAKNSYHPGIFIAKKGTGSKLHSDSKCTRFYMFMLSGAKLWRLAPPSENWRLAPKYEAQDWYPLKYEADIINPDFEAHPDLDGALIYETVLKPGELLFVPEMWAHQVENLEDSVSTSLNWVDKDTLPNHQQFTDHVLSFMRSNNDWEEARQFEIENKHKFHSFLLTFDHPARGNNLDWAQYFGSHELIFQSVPLGLRLWLREHDVNERIDHQLRTALHVAVWLNMPQAAAFLVDNGADIHAVDTTGFTPLHVAEMFGLWEMAQWLRSLMPPMAAPGGIPTMPPPPHMMPPPQQAPPRMPGVFSEGSIPQAEHPFILHTEL
eukprot:g14523.t1